MKGRRIKDPGERYGKALGRFLEIERTMIRAIHRWESARRELARAEKKLDMAQRIQGGDGMEDIKLAQARIASLETDLAFAYDQERIAKGRIQRLENRLRLIARAHLMIGWTAQTCASAALAVLEEKTNGLI